MSKHGVKKARVQVLDLTQDPSKFWKSDILLHPGLSYPDTNPQLYFAISSNCLYWEWILSNRCNDRQHGYLFK